MMGERGHEVERGKKGPPFFPLSPKAPGDPLAGGEALGSRHRMTGSAAPAAGAGEPPKVGSEAPAEGAVFVHDYALSLKDVLCEKGCIMERVTEHVKKEMTQEAKARLSAARAAMGSSPRARGQEKLRIALDWIYRWGWSSPQVLDMATSGSRSGLAARLERLKLIKQTKTEAGGSVKAIPVFMLTLTSVGLDEVERLREDLIQYDLDPYKIDQTKLRHDEIAQRATADALKKGSITDFRTPKELAAKSEKNVKQPDILWIDKSGQRMGIEVELSAKWDRKLDQFVFGCLQSLSEKAQPVQKVDVVAVISDSKAIIKRYKEAFLPGSKIGIWTKNEKGFWSQTKEIEVPKWVEGKMLWRFIE